MFVTAKDIRRYIASLENDKDMVAITDNSYECLLAKTVQWKYGDGEKRAHVGGSNTWLTLGKDVVLVSEVATEIANRFDKIYERMTPITRARLYEKMPDLKLEVTNESGS